MTEISFELLVRPWLATGNYTLTDGIPIKQNTALSTQYKLVRKLLPSISETMQTLIKYMDSRI